MNRQQKEAVVSQIKEKLTSAEAIFLVGYKGLTVEQLQALRGNLRQLGGTFKVAKARLMKLAVNNMQGSENFKNNLKDQVGLVFVEKEVPSIAKALCNFSKNNNDILQVISGYFEEKTLTADQVNFLATLPPKEILLAQLLGTMQAPIAGFARVLHTVIAQLLYVLKQISEKENS